MHNVCINIRQNRQKMQETVKYLQKMDSFEWKMKETQKNSSKNEKNIQKGVDKRKSLLYNRHINFIFPRRYIYSLSPIGIRI